MEAAWVSTLAPGRLAQPDVQMLQQGEVPCDRLHYVARTTWCGDARTADSRTRHPTCERSCCSAVVTKAAAVARSCLLAN